MQINYGSATVYFPEYDRGKGPGPEFSEAGMINGNTLSFTRNDFLIQAHLRNHYIDPAIANEPSVRIALITPAIHIVTTDIKTIDDLFDELRALAKDHKLNETFYFEIDPISGNYKVYDHMGSRGGDPFAKLKRFKDFPVPSTMLQEQYQKYPGLAKLIHQEEGPGRLAHVRGSTLRIATKKVLAVYQIADELKGLSFE